MHHPLNIDWFVYTYELKNFQIWKISFVQSISRFLSMIYSPFPYCKRLFKVGLVNTFSHKIKYSLALVIIPIFFDNFLATREMWFFNVNFELKRTTEGDFIQSVEKLDYQFSLRCEASGVCLSEILLVTSCLLTRIREFVPMHHRDTFRGRMPCVVFRF